MMRARSAIFSHDQKVRPFVIVLVGSSDLIDAKDYLDKAIESKVESITTHISLAMRTVGSKKFSFLDFSNQLNGQTELSTFYKVASTIIISPSNMEEFNSWKRNLLSLGSTYLPVIVVTNDEDILAAAKNTYLHTVKKSIAHANLDDFLLKIQTRNPEIMNAVYPVEKKRPLFFSADKDAKEFLEADSLAPDERRALQKR
jgi:hypothetical protein